MDEELKAKIAKSVENPDGGIWNEEKQKWEGYKPAKGVKPNWDPFNPDKRKNRLTLNERKFLYFLGKTGKLKEAYLAAYKVKDLGNPILQNARIHSLANQVLARLRKKAPGLTSATTLDDISVDFVKKELLKLYNHEESTIHEKTRLLELMGKTQAMFTDKQIVDTKVREVVDQVYRETDDDFGSIDQRQHPMGITEDEIGTA